jgi:excisionase family DNA binding protein
VLQSGLTDNFYGDFSMLDIKVYSLKEASKILGVTERTLYNYIKAGRIKVQKIGGKWIITEENLKKFIKGEL